MLSAVKNFIITFCVSALIFGLAAYFIVSFAMGSILPAKEVDVKDPSNIITAPTDLNGETTGSIDENTIDPNKIDGSSFTALLIGTDYQPDILDDYDFSEINTNVEGFPKTERIIAADAIVLLHIDKESQKFVVSSLPSNMMLSVDGVQLTLSELYSNKGIAYFCSKVTAITGLNIDYYAVASINDFSNIIDKIGGVTFNVPITMSYEDDSQDLVIDLKKGEQLLNGNRALQLLRYNTYADGTLTRVKVIMNFAQALLDKLTKPEYLTQVAALYQEINQYIDTNFTNEALMANLELIFTYPNFEKIEIAYPGTIKSTKKGNAFLPDIVTAINQFTAYKND